MRRLLAPLCLLTLTATAQPGDRLTTYVDCPGYVPGCDVDFFQTEVGFARFVRNPTVASVYVLIVDEDTGGGGERYTLFFEGRGAAAGRRDTLVTSAPPAASDDDQRRALLGRLALGLAGFASQTSLADRISIAYDAPEGAEAATVEPVRDPWNSWVFEIDGNANSNGQSQSLSYNLFAGIRASRVTDDLKVSVRPRVRYNRNEFTLNDDSTFVSDNANFGLNARAVASLTDHWSAGARVDGSRDTFSNYALRVRAAPAVEYNLFPYAESTRRQVRLFYEAGVEWATYQDTTVLGRTAEVLPAHEAGVAAEFAQPWGSVDVFTRASQYLSRPDRYNVSVGGGVELRVFQGFNVEVDGFYEFVRDQISLRAEQAADGQVLTGDQELPTGYQYFVSVGFSYTFGSIYNQVVNARFGD
ncbi:hypothetical protein [Rubrivirga marina]|uniref:DUF481 domain-containing protein n=1 Tax=Rubrivirga marina TaxID=1196024 RepID=A0A271J481_9BACT|nr:hypothetical protein [Rubrivirga marina]PAP78097.1 hypothetical protein BSZ37_17465 [Rubrivirga marina]